MFEVCYTVGGKWKLSLINAKNSDLAMNIWLEAMAAEENNAVFVSIRQCDDGEIWSVY